MARASEDALADLHRIVAEQLAARIAAGTATASDLSNAIKFLKDNNISCTPGTSNALDDLMKQLEEASGKPRPVSPEDESDLEDAMRQLEGDY
jgi:ABC-type Zn uptake system ZnuABC Zn-binding protein ZnuA